MFSKAGCGGRATMTTILSCAALAISTAIGILPITSAVAQQAAVHQTCIQLDALKQEYAGVKLTAKQQKMKVRLVSWYVAHCTARHRLEAGHLQR
jgi:hypothetical protein